MIVRIAALWVLGLFTIVPYGIYHLLFYAQRDEYAFLITIVLFWIFGFWGVVMPIVTAVKIRQIFRALEMAGSKEKFLEILNSGDSQDTMIDLIASENRIPRFFAKKIYTLAVKKLSSAEKSRAIPAGS